MTLIASRLEALVAARVGATGPMLSEGELVKPLLRFTPAELTQAAWRDRLVEVVHDLRAREVLDARHRLRDAGELTRLIGRSGARTWPQLATRVLPGLALGISASDGKLHARLDSRDAWAAAIVGRVLGMWVDGPPPSLPALCDALAWRELGLPGKPKRCPPEIRALFLQRQFHIEAGPPERLVRVVAAREVGAPSPARLCDALVCGWLAGRVLGASRSATGEGHGDAAAVSEGQARSFVGDVLQAVDATRDGWFGDRKVFVSAVWDALRRDPTWAAVTLDEFKARLVAAHRAGELVLARADFVAAMNPELVAASEIAVDGASFHFLVKEPVT